MSAILGLVGPHSPDDLGVMAERLSHRGRHKRLESVRPELSVGVIGAEPEAMLFRDGDSVIVAAGRLYAGGGSPSGLAESIFRGLSRPGTSGLADIDGDFAAAAIRDRDVTFVRDFFGCMPLFWGLRDDGCLAFASEYKAFVALDRFTPVADRSMLQYLQAAKKMPPGRTLLENVHAVRPGRTLVREGQAASCEAFEPLTCNVTCREEEQAKRTVSDTFRAALARRSAPDDPIGLALSGGIDSISMAFQLRSLHPDREIHTFTAGFGSDDPEMATAEKVAAHIGAIHHPVHTPPSLMLSELERLVWHLEDPCARSEALQLMRVGEVAAGYVGALLSGQGADGLFAGMPRHKLVGLAGRLAPVRRPLFEIFDLTQLGIAPESLVGKALAAALYRGRVPPVPIVIGAAPAPRPQRIPAGSDFLNRFLAAGYQTSASQDTAKFERTFGASGVAYTSPCLDVSLARTAFTIDERLKIHKGHEKYVFRRALGSVVPAEFRDIPKHPQRMKYDREFADCLDRMADRFLAQDDVRARGFFDPGSIDRIRRRAPGRPYAAEAAMRLWTAIATEIWARQFLDGRAAAA